MEKIKYFSVQNIGYKSVHNFVIKKKFSTFVEANLKLLHSLLKLNQVLYNVRSFLRSNISRYNT